MFPKSKKLNLIKISYASLLMKMGKYEQSVENLLAGLENLPESSFSECEILLLMDLVLHNQIQQHSLNHQEDNESHGMDGNNNNNKTKVDIEDPYLDETKRKKKMAYRHKTLSETEGCQRKY